MCSLAQLAETTHNKEQAADKARDSRDGINPQLISDRLRLIHTNLTQKYDGQTLTDT
jgi:hypothetical protein